MQQLAKAAALLVMVAVLPASRRQLGQGVQAIAAGSGQQLQQLLLLKPQTQGWQGTRQLPQLLQGWRGLSPKSNGCLFLSPTTTSSSCRHRQTRRRRRHRSSRSRSSSSSSAQLRQQWHHQQQRH
jgi:hypothetical protein